MTWGITKASQMLVAQAASTSEDEFRGAISMLTCLVKAQSGQQNNPASLEF